MTPIDLLNIRNKIEHALKAIGWESKGAGVSLCDPPTADIEGDLDGQRLAIYIKVKGASLTPPEGASLPWVAQEGD